MSNGKKILYKINRYYDSVLSLGVSKVIASREINKIMSISHISNKKLETEEEWVKKWSVLSKYVNRKFYRTFSKYVGEDINIVPDDICHNIIEPILNPIRYRSLYADKCMFEKFLFNHFTNQVTPRTLLRNINGIYYDENYNELDESEINIDIISDAFDEIIVKPSVDSSSGRNILFFAKKTGGFFLVGNNKEKLSIAFLEETFGKNFLIQECLKQSSFMSQFCSTSVNTLRVQLYRSVENNKIVIPNIIMRIGKSGSLVDNAHAGGCFVGVEADGLVHDRVCNQYGETSHVFNDIDFKKSTFVIPEFDKVIQLAIEVGKCIPHCRCIALDIMIDSSGMPRLIEYNVSVFSLWLFQFTTGSAFGSYTDEVIEYCVKHKKEASRIFVTF